MRAVGTCCLIESAADCALVRLRAASQIWDGLCRENSSTEALPRPLLAPVMRIVLPVRSGMSLVGWKGMLCCCAVVDGCGMWKVRPFYRPQGAIGVDWRFRWHRV